ncbi:hypothetical protein B0T24DRAFT_628367 [Lasiosphaeria ovina]|uniref:Uncharacterized protein n=1 Tax=Lasiosphaeria ovina TaxID=92902 RepID=A0AAE0N5R0_9PEZI|nr:hypothetical protein B0T24DRAFT_628367 [Lasiosphaeria ovina]
MGGKFISKVISLPRYLPTLLFLVLALSFLHATMSRAGVSFTEATCLALPCLIYLSHRLKEENGTDSFNIMHDGCFYEL